MKIRFAVGPQPGWLGAEDLITFAGALEASGFDGIWLSDVPLGPGLDPLLGLALIAGRTSRLRLGANVVPLGRNPFLLARDLAQLDQISGARLLLSFVPGLGRPGEREVLGLPGSGRGEVLEETLRLVRSWWTGAEIESFSASEASSELARATRPVQDPLEVWLGGRGPKALDRVGRIADGWLGAMLTPEEAKAARESIRAAAARAGREIDPEHFGLSIAYSRTPSEPATLRPPAARRPDIDPLAILPVGACQLRSVIEAHVGVGLSKFVVRPAETVASWQDEAEWLEGAILDLQT